MMNDRMIKYRDSQGILHEVPFHPIHGGIDPPSEDNPPAQDAPQAIEVNGQTLTAADIQELQVKAEMGEDYTKKTMQLAEERRQLNVERDTIARSPRPEPTSSNPPLEEDDYTDPAMASLSKKVDMLAESVGSVATTLTTTNEAEARAKHDAAVDKTFDAMEELVKPNGKFPLANPKAVGADIRSYYDINKRLPSDAEVVEFAKREHDIMVARGATITVTESVGDKPPEDSVKPVVGSDGTGTPAPVERTTPKYKIEDDDVVEKDLQSFIADRDLGIEPT